MDSRARHRRSLDGAALPESGCRIRYHFLLGDAADLKGPPLAERIGAAIVAPPASWLVRPLHADPGLQYRFHFDVPAGVRALAGLDQVEGLDQVYQAPVAALAAAPPAAFGSLGLTFSRSQAAARGGDRARPPRPLRRAARRGGQARRVDGRRLARPRAPRSLAGDRAARGGDKLTVVTRTGGGAELVAHIGAALSPKRSPPPTRSSARWCGSPCPPSTPTTPDSRVAWSPTRPRSRARAPARFRPRPRGSRCWAPCPPAPASGCSPICVSAKRPTTAARSTTPCARSPTREGVYIAARWTLERLLTICDRAVGSPIVTTLYGELDEAGLATELSSAWRRLGIVVDDDGKITFDDAAPLAAIRRSLTARGR